MELITIRRSLVGPGNEGQQRGDAQIEAVREGEADQQDAHQQPHQITRSVS
jgi:hypothetical protein